MQTIIFGGAFDPPHLEHLRICKEAMKELGADKLVLVPTLSPPHKQSAVIPFDLRVKMLEEEFADCGFDFEINKIESTTDGVNYASDVLEKIYQNYESPIYLIGADSLLAFDTWHQPEKILSLMPIAVAGRKGYNAYLFEKAEELTQKYGGKIRLLDVCGEDISSTIVKAKLLIGLDLPLDEHVKQTIAENHLFEQYRPLVEKLKARQTSDLFFHSIAVALRAVDVNSRCHLNLDFDEVFLAGLLHDNSKQMLSVEGVANVPSNALGSPVLHQFLGAERARTDFGIEDEKICDAIRYHTTAKADMSTLEKLIYSADMMSEDRDFDGLDILVKQIYSDFEEGFFACLDKSYHHVLEKGRGMYPLTEEAYLYYSAEYAKKHNPKAE